MSAIHEVHEPFGEDISVHGAWDVPYKAAAPKGTAFCFSNYYWEEGARPPKCPPQTALVSFGTPVKTSKPTPPRETTLFARDVTVRPLTSLGAARARRPRQATVPAAGAVR